MKAIFQSKTIDGDRVYMAGEYTIGDGPNQVPEADAAKYAARGWCRLTRAENEQVSPAMAAAIESAAPVATHNRAHAIKPDDVEMTNEVSEVPNG